MRTRILQGDCRETLKTLPPGSVHCVVTSPPYWGLRSYLPGCACFHLPGHTEPVPCTVLDPFLGSGTTSQVALELGRAAVGCELNPEYVPLIERRTDVTPGFAF